MGSQENRKTTASQVADCFKLEFPVEGNYIWLSMNTKAKMFIHSIDKTKVKMDGANGLEIILCYGTNIRLVGPIITKGPIIV